MTIRAITIVGFASILLVGALAPRAASAQEVPAVLIERHLRDSGHANTTFERQEDTLFVTFENRLFRDEAAGLAEVGTRIAEFAVPQQTLRVTSRIRGMAMVETDLDLHACRDMSMQNRTLWACAGAQRVNGFAPRSGFGWTQPVVDITFHPFYQVPFGDFTQRDRARWGVAPEIGVTLWTGMRLSAQLEIVVKEAAINRTQTFQPGRITLSQWLRTPGDVWLAIGGGRFSENRYGVHGHAVRYFFGGRVGLHAEAGQTGLAQMRDGTLFYTGLERAVYSGGVEYISRPLGLSVKASAGQYLWGDDGVRLDVRKAVGPVQFALYGVSTSIDQTFGATLHIPLFPTRYVSQGPLRIAPARYMTIDYRNQVAGGAGTSYRTGYGLDFFEQHLHPFVIEQQLRGH